MKHPGIILIVRVFVAIIVGFSTGAGTCYGESARETLLNQNAGLTATGDMITFAKSLSADHKQYHPHATRDCALLDPSFFINGGKFNPIGHTEDMEHDRKNCPICNPPPVQNTPQPQSPSAPSKGKDKRAKPAKPRTPTSTSQPLPPPASPRDIDPLLDKLKQGDRAHTSQSTEPGTETDEGIPTPTKQKNGNGNHWVGDALDGLSDAYGDKKSGDVLTQVFGESPVDRKNGQLTDRRRQDDLVFTEARAIYEKELRQDPEQRAIAEHILNNAFKSVGSGIYDINMVRGPYGEGKNKCNLYIHETLCSAGSCPPLRDRIFNPPAYPLLAKDYADREKNINGLPVVAGAPMPGDIVAESIDYSNASGHVGIVVSYDPVTKTGKSISVSSYTEKVEITDWGFRHGQNVTFRRPQMREWTIPREK